jgi:hypothetical protein
LLHQVNDKSEVDDDLQERVVTISGRKADCAEAVSLILKKLLEEGEDVYKYTVNAHADSYGGFRDRDRDREGGRSETNGNSKSGHGNNGSRRVSISTSLQRGNHDRDSREEGGGGGRGRRGSSRERDRGDRDNGKRGRGSSSLHDAASSSLRSSGAALLSAETTITVAVPDDIVGNILGKQVR